MIDILIDMQYVITKAAAAPKYVLSPLKCVWGTLAIRAWSILAHVVAHVRGLRLRTVQPAGYTTLLRAFCRPMISIFNLSRRSAGIMPAIQTANLPTRISYY